MEVGEFHWTNGWYFKRLDGGAVRIRKRDTAHDDAPIVLEVTIDADSWCSIASHVTAGGEAANWAAICALHKGG